MEYNLLTFSWNCPKCNSSDIDRKYKEEIKKERRNAFGELITPRPEHLKCRCNDCGFLWKSQTADQTPKWNVPPTKYMSIEGNADD